MDDETMLVWAVLFSAIGLGYLTYGRRQKAVMPLVTGVALIIFPYVIPNLYLMLAVGAALLALPYFIRR
jgi:hypothetical protein